MKTMYAFCLSEVGGVILLPAPAAKVVEAVGIPVCNTMQSNPILCTYLTSAVDSDPGPKQII
jgi:hypothetical protein